MQLNLRPIVEGCSREWKEVNSGLYLDLTRVTEKVSVSLLGSDSTAIKCGQLYKHQGPLNCPED